MQRQRAELIRYRHFCKKVLRLLRHADCNYAYAFRKTIPSEDDSLCYCLTFRANNEFIFFTEWPVKHECITEYTGNFNINKFRRIALVIQKLVRKYINTSIDFYIQIRVDSVTCNYNDVMYIYECCNKQVTKFQNA